MSFVSFFLNSNCCFFDLVIYYFLGGGFVKHTQSFLVNLENLKLKSVYDSPENHQKKNGVKKKHLIFVRCHCSKLQQQQGDG